jgi:hypothetical protein
MNTSPTVWLPAGQNLTLAQRQALAVPARAKPTQAQYKEMLTDSLQSQINANPQEAKATMEMSQEQLPEPYLIAQNQPKSQWAQALIQSDSMQPLLSLIDWTQAGSMREAEPTSLQLLLEHLP